MGGRPKARLSSYGTARRPVRWRLRSAGGCGYSGDGFSHPGGATSAALAWLIALGGCSENFGTAPVAPPGPVAVASEAFAGPLAARAVTTLAGEGTTLWLGTDRGTYRGTIVPDGLRWWPGASDPAALAVVAIAGEPTATVWIVQSRGGGSDDLRLSVDAGSSFDFLPNPLPFVAQVDRVGVLPPSPHRPSGAIIASQGVRLFVRATDGDAWVDAQLPHSPAEFGCSAGDAAGHVALAVRDPGGWAVWTSADAARSFEEVPGPVAGEVLALAWRGDGGLAIATPNGISAGSDTVSFGPGLIVQAAGLRARADRVEYLVAVGSGSLAAGQLPGPPPVLQPLPAGVSAALGLVADADGGWVAGNDGTVWRVTAAGTVPLAFDGGELDFTAGAVDPRLAAGVLLARGFGDVFRGSAASRTPDALGRRTVSSVVSLLPDLSDASGLFAGAFGVNWHPGTLGGAWEERNAGQSSYVMSNSGGPVYQATALAQPPDDPQDVWLGAGAGDGVYRSVDGGRNWVPVHAGLGAPGAVEGEDGLSGITQVRAFAFPGNEVWMAGFRGGVYRLDPRADAWVQLDRGLPDARTGASLDTCCTVPLVREVDVRDLVALPDGALLAATGHGVYRDDARTGMWSASREGLSNGDVYCFALHPTRPGWVLAGCRGSLGAPEFLFLSRDAGRSWAPLASGLRRRWVLKVMWSDPSALELVAVLSNSGAWRMELSP